MAGDTVIPNPQHRLGTAGAKYGVALPGFPGSAGRSLGNCHLHIPYTGIFETHPRGIMTTQITWFYWALFSAVFAALTAIFAKIGIQGVDSDLAPLVRTAIIIVVLSVFVWSTGKWSNPLTLSPKTWLFLGLSGLATGASWVCYFRALQIGEASKVAPVDKLSLVLAFKR